MKVIPTEFFWIFLSKLQRNKPNCFYWDNPSFIHSHTGISHTVPNASHQCSFKVVGVKRLIFHETCLLQILQAFFNSAVEPEAAPAPTEREHLLWIFFFFLQNFKLKFIIHHLLIKWTDWITNIQNVNFSSDVLTSLGMRLCQRWVSDLDVYNLTFFWRTLTLRSFTSSMSFRSWISPACVPFSSAISWICFVFLFSIVSFSSRRKRNAST